MPAPAEFYDYSLFGLRIRSTIALPELGVIDWPGVPDVNIEQSALEPRDTRPGYNVVDNEIVLDIPQVARFAITCNSIRIDPEPAAPLRNIRLYLLGSGIGALLHQRRMLPLHANAIEFEGKAIAFMGKSGAGKSTLAAWFHDRGYRLISDDICVVSMSASGKVWAHPGIPRLRLWQDALEASGRSAADFERSYVDDSQWDKFDVPVPSPGDFGAALELRELYLLDTGDSVEFCPLSGVEAADAVFANTYRGGVIAELGSERDHMAAAVALVTSVPIIRFRRPWSVAQQDRTGQLIIDHLRALNSQSVRE